jgi:NAD(P)-dependent dehydrogenase (short-subunit alcohol dehydrogenase family)
MKNALVTGATDGIGRETARQLLARGVRVLVHGRNQSKATRQAGDLSLQAGAAADPVWGDLSSMPEVVALADQVRDLAPALDVLIHNAGVFETRRHVTADGFERTMAVNHFAPFLLTRRLLDTVGAAAAGRIVVVSSIAHQSGALDVDDLTFAHGYDGYSAYAASKLANILFTRALAERLEGSSTTVNALHPGVIGTKLLRVGFGMGGAPVEQGARTSVYLATSSQVAGASGKYFLDCREARPSRAAQDRELAEALWARSEQLLEGFLQT